MSMRLLPVLRCLVVVPLCGPAAAQTARPGISCAAPAMEDVIASVSSHGEFRLASGRTIKLADVRLPLEADDFGRALAWLQSLAARPVMVPAPAGGADRWNRIPAAVAILDDTSPIDLAELLVAEGFAIVDAGDRPGLCRPELLGREERARAGRRGLWAGERHRPVRADDLERLQGLVGHFALVEGVVRSIGERRERTYLNFGPDWTSDLTVVIPKRTWAGMRERGLSAATLKGRRVRARGVLDRWQGVAMEIAAADMLEVLGQEPSRR
jgi:endonuclease YncB( thermonuclease family)